MFESSLASEAANKAALLLVNERYNAQLAPFVKDSAARLTYVSGEIERILTEVCVDLDADFDYVSSRFQEHLAAAILNKDHAKREKLKVKPGWIKNDKSSPSLDGIHTDDPMNHGEVSGAGYEEARAPDAKVDLKKDTQKGTYPGDRKQGCVRCGEDLHPRLAKISACCDTCSDALRKKKKKKQEEDSYEAKKEADLGDENLGQDSAPVTVPYILPPPGIHFRTHDLLAKAGLTATVHYPSVGGSEPFSQEVPGNPMAGWKILQAAEQAGIPVDQIEVQVETDSPEEVLRLFDQAGGRVSKVADIYSDQPEHIDLSDATVNPLNADTLQYECSICHSFEGTQQVVKDHVTTAHADVLQRMQQQYTENPGNTTQVPVAASVKQLADKIQRITKDIIEDEAIVQPLPQSPGDNFDTLVNDLANRAAATQFSQVDDATINQLAQQLGVDAEEIRSNLQVVAVFDNYVGVNGEISDNLPAPPEGYTEVDSASINATAQEALIPTDLVISKVAEQMNMTDELAYQQVKDRYGADLPDTYHAQVTGEYHYYLPASLAQNATTDGVAMQQGDVGPSSQNPNGAPIPGGADIPRR